MSTPNHLIHEKSPYLLQHAHNPVDWFPWGEDAFEKARRENKPILVSIGYSTCHWCHVMEKESFDKPEIAEVMNENLVCIKVDREERPDVDKIYMTAVTAMTGAGGWPLNVFLTPDLKPFYGGTYFPPEDRWGRIGWPELVKKIGLTWKDPEEHKEILLSAENLTEHITQFLGRRSGEGDLKPSILEEALKRFEADYDSVLGGFGNGPKFPMPVNHNFLMRFYAAFKETKPKQAEAALLMSLGTLRSIAKGGIYDHLGGGFARYSTDEQWRVPHFEKMLYDNAQLIVNYLEAFQITKDELFEQVARESLEYVLRDMTDPEGGFYSAEDADSLPPELERGMAASQSEGAFYLWKKKEILSALGNEKGEIFCFRYGVLDYGNAPSDPQGEFTDKNILYIGKTLDETADHFGKSKEEIEKILAESEAKLFAIRAKRPRPHLDDKVIASWNGLMISALAKAAQILGDEKYLQAAEKGARFIESGLYDAKTKTLYRRWRKGERKILGISDDYAFLAQGCLDLYQAGFQAHWFKFALELTRQLLARFYDEATAGIFMTEKGRSDLILRVKEDVDNVEPSAGSVGITNFLRIGHWTGKKEFENAAGKMLKAYAGNLQANPRAFPQMLAALSLALGKPVDILLVGDPSGLETRAFVREVHSRFLPFQTMLLFKDRWSVPQEMSWVSEILKPERASRDPVTAYVCLNYSCSLPTGDFETFKKILDGEAAIKN